MPAVALFSHSQSRRFEDADEARLRWILDTPIVREQEAELYGALPIEAGPILELGAGEGLLPRFRPEVMERGYVGSDLFPSRVAALRRSRPNISGTAADASALPFRDGCFQTVLCRDLLHHLQLPERRRAVDEMARVLAPDGVAALLEPNAARSPLMAAFSLAIPTERMALGFSATTLRELSMRSFREVRVSHLAPSMLYRLLLHHRFGAPRLAQRAVTRRALALWGRLARAAPANRFGYLLLLCRGPR
jgi:SAM-dependent methyltransferase